MAMAAAASLTSSSGSQAAAFLFRSHSSRRARCPPTFALPRCPPPAPRYRLLPCPAGPATRVPSSGFPIVRAPLSAPSRGFGPLAAVPDPGAEDVGGGGAGLGGGGGEGSGRGGGEHRGEGGGSSEDGEGKKKMEGGMSMSQKLTLGYAALVGIGGLMGYLKGGSQKSLAAGGFSALLLYFVYTQLPVRPAFASSLGLGLSAALLVVMGSRFRKSGKIFPAGVVSLVSIVMVGGYFHGILRSLHA